MPHDTPLITTIVAGLVLAFIFGAIANRLKMPPLVGYLLAGILAGPFTPGFVADTEIAGELSEIGVILLMFGVGLNFSLKDLLSVQAVAVPGALLRIAGGTLMGMGLAWLMHWSLGGGLILGLALSVASTVVLLKTLQDRHIVESDRGRIAVGWVIVEDIAMVLALVLIPAFAGLMGGTTEQLADPFVDVVERLAHVELNVWGVLLVTVVKLAAFVGFMLVVGRRVIPWILHLTAHTGSRELFRLAVLAIALGVAAGASYLFGVSLALGAFFAGMILSESELSNRAAQESLPFRDAFAVLFFVSVGMLFDPSILWTAPLQVLGVLFIILIGKSAIGFVLVILLRRSVGAALTISASLAQIGEFSFILATLGISLGLMPPEGRSLILAGAIISIVVNPLLMWLAERLSPRLEARLSASSPSIVAPQRVEPSMAGAAAPVPAEIVDDRTPTGLSGHVVLIGYGRVGTVVAEGLKRDATPFVLIEDAERRIAAAHDAGIEVVVGNAASGKALELANVGAARTLLIAIPNAFEAGQAVEQARHRNAGLAIIARAHSDEEVSYLHDLGANEVIMGEREIGLGMLGLTERRDPLVPDAGHVEPPIRAPEIEAAAVPPAAVAATATLVEPVSIAAPGATSSAVPELAPEILEARIEAAHPQHEIAGPAEPPDMVPALGEMPAEEPPAPDAGDVAADSPETGAREAAPSPVAAPEAPAPAASPEVPEDMLDLPAPRRRPAATPEKPFNPEVLPAED